MGFLGRLFGKEGKTATSKDPVCGMMVEPAKAKGQSTHGATTYLFCSSGCKTKFDADPHRYLGAHSH